MSIELSDVLVKKFEAEAIQTFQESDMELRNYCRVKNITGAQSVQFNVIGTGVAYERTSIQTPIPVMDVAHTPKTATVKNYAASELTDIFLNNQVGFDERKELVDVITAALHRRAEQVVIDALDAASITNTVANNISGSTDNLTIEALNESSRLLGSKVPKDGRIFLCHDDGFYHLLLEADVKTIDTNMVKPLADGKLPYMHGFVMKPIADRTEGGLTIDGSNDRTNYAWQKSAVGLAINMEPRITIDWEPSFGAHRVTGWLSAGAVVIQEAGVVKVTTREA